MIARKLEAIMKIYSSLFSFAVFFLIIFGGLSSAKAMTHLTVTPADDL